ncbi:MAG: Sfum_1244 family protein [Pseudomonadota bacterium]
MIDIEALTGQVLHNCAIADSKHAGLYSICGLAMRLRDLYKWEKGLDPWVEEDPPKLLEWIGDKEEKWDSLQDKEFREMMMMGRAFDPFDTEGINTVLEPRGLFYGAGYVYSLKPTFILAHLEEKRRIEGYPLYILGHELARDLLTLPALSQENRIFIRKESGKHFFWNQIFFVKKSGREALEFALEKYGIRTQDLKALHENLARIFSEEIDTLIHHELGELKDTVFERDLWRNMISAFPFTPIELFVRAVKDLLADTNEYGTLHYITRERKKASLAFYVAFMDGVRKELFPEITEAFSIFKENHDWQVIEHASFNGYEKAKRYAQEITLIYKAGREKADMTWAGDEIKRRLLVPLGIVLKEV